MSKEHLAVAVALEVPVAVVLTKCDLVDGARLTAVLDQVRYQQLGVCSRGEVLELWNGCWSNEAVGQPSHLHWCSVSTLPDMNR